MASPLIRFGSTPLFVIVLYSRAPAAPYARIGTNIGRSFGFVTGGNSGERRWTLFGGPSGASGAALALGGETARVNLVVFSGRGAMLA
jgi:hypothetical protein